MADATVALHTTTDAQVWAREWCRIAREIRDRGDEIIDEGWMIGWFANAIEIGRDAGRGVRVGMSHHGPGEPVPLEGHPSDRQKDRLEEFLAELALISTKYGIIVEDEHETLEFLDVFTGTLIGVGLVPFTAPGDITGRVTAYVPADSILDGVWLADTDHEPAEQYLVTNVHPRRDSP